MPTAARGEFPQASGRTPTLDADAAWEQPHTAADERSEQRDARRRARVRRAWAASRIAIREPSDCESNEPARAALGSGLAISSRMRDHVEYVEMHQPTGPAKGRMRPRPA